LRISDYLKDNQIFLDIEAASRDAAIAAVVNKMNDQNLLEDAAKFLQEVNEREKLGSTGIGKGVALPHARTKYVKAIVVTMARLKNGVDFHADDKQPVKLIFLLGTPLNAVGDYLKVLSKLSKILREDKVRKKLLKAGSAREIIDILKDVEE